MECSSGWNGLNPPVVAPAVSLFSCNAHPPPKQIAITLTRVTPVESLSVARLNALWPAGSRPVSCIRASLPQQNVCYKLILLLARGLSSERPQNLAQFIVGLAPEILWRQLRAAASCTKSKHAQRATLPIASNVDRPKADAIACQG